MASGQCSSLLAGCLLAGFIALTASARQLHKATLETTCARPSYVFLPSQQPDLWSTQSFDRILSISYGTSTDQLQQRCDSQPSCVAFSTDGLLVKADANTGKAGPFKQLGHSQYNASLSSPRRKSNCTGTYVFDGTVVLQKQHTQPAGVSHLPGSVGAASSATATAVSGPWNGTLHGNKTASAQQIRLVKVYVKGQSNGGGKVGWSYCSLC